MSTLPYLPAVQILGMFRSGELAPTEYMEALFSRIREDARHPLPLNAFAETLEEDARSQARSADEAYRSGPEMIGDKPLLGLPVATKEKHALAGRVCSQGVLAHAETIATEDHPVVERVRSAGGIVHARTTSPEFSCATVTHGELWGVTRNPWDRALSPGGSSGGAAAALAGGMTPLATASDIAGSTRLPAAFCGLVGYKAPYGTVPGAGAFAADWYRGDGPMARTVADVALLTQVMRGRHSKDHASIPSPPFCLSSEPELLLEKLQGRRIAYSPTLGDYPVENSVRIQVESAARAFAAAGAEVTEISLPWSTEKTRRTTMAHFGHLLAEGMRSLFRGREDTMEAYTRRFLQVAEDHAAELSLFETLEREHQMQAELAHAMEDHDVLITPVSAIRSLEADQDYLDGVVVPDQPNGEDRALEHYWEAHMTVPFNVANRCPALAVPVGLSSGFPVGMQVIGHPFDEQAVFEVGAAWEVLSSPLVTELPIPQP